MEFSNQLSSIRNPLVTHYTNDNIPTNCQHWIQSLISLEQMHTLSVYHSAVDNSRHSAATLSVEFQRDSLRQEHTTHCTFPKHRTCTLVQSTRTNIQHAKLHALHNVSSDKQNYYRTGTIATTFSSCLTLFSMLITVRNVKECETLWKQEINTLSLIHIWRCRRRG